ncbi:MAG: metal ABC transporter ATP-binding protein [Pelatocladus maniniholoensis HA4357-MV3]|jgi:manganese/iron transport system ATP-binding protein|uniref:Metal ABC transporter ATP-binding protein n=1 Tax=Pelatocladus maniniholoensis HA4357-MV3 TaxID=1117104 RepID=A0A9E3H4Y7_9NOST|nr:metal ABC transporter ATP-binding protein [Pelatocladus maniniholoensis HA4357-MV3]
MVEVENLSVRYRGRYALEAISFKLEPSQIVGIIGPNGAGKSTMVKAMLGLIPIASGTVKFCDKPLRLNLSKVAYVPQRANIDWDYPTTVWNVVMMARTVKTGLFRKPSRMSEELAKAALERVGILDLRDRQIGELSGGQQQRVFLARSLAKQADLFIFDEPFTGIDRRTEDIIFEVFEELKVQGKTLLVINHDLGETLNYYDQLLLLNKQLIAFGCRQEVLTATNIQQTYGISLRLVVA